MEDMFVFTIAPRKMQETFKLSLFNCRDRFGSQKDRSPEIFRSPTNNSLELPCYRLNPHHIYFGFRT
ncbi:MAG: hypothetical protein HC939_17700 [Pleurocapsa sp. SU_5_0]|nr:hypothetical protein [Pleurocapsa sp. SU_5_0]